MSEQASQPAAVVPLESGKAIFCVVPDDGTDKKLLHDLRSELGILRGHSMHCRGIAALGDAKTKRGKLPASDLVKVIRVVVDAEQADSVFDFIFERADVDRPGRGFMWQTPLIGCTLFALPGDVPDETDL